MRRSFPTITELFCCNPLINQLAKRPAPRRDAAVRDEPNHSKTSGMPLWLCEIFKAKLRRRYGLSKGLLIEPPQNVREAASRGYADTASARHSPVASTEGCDLGGVSTFSDAAKL